MPSKLTKRIVLLFLSLSSSGLYAVTEQQIQDEIDGTSPTPTILIARDENAQILGGQAIAATGVLLIPESTNDRVMAFDPLTGDLIDADFIASDPTNLSTPIHAILAADNASILVSDQLDDVVQRYDLDGNYLGVFAPLGGLDNTILDNVRGIELDNSSNLLVTVASGANANSVASFDASGNYTGNFIANNSGGLNSPFSIQNTGIGSLVSAINSDAIHQYSNSGVYIGDLTTVDNFPEQLSETTNGNILVANFSGAQEGIVEFDSTGMLIGIYDPVTLGGYRGVYELPNGNILTTNGSGVHEIDRSGNLIETKIAGVSARFIELVRPLAAPAAAIPSTSLISLLILMFGLIGTLLFVKPWLLSNK
jgi:hypothetical protein